MCNTDQHNMQLYYVQILHQLIFRQIICPHPPCINKIHTERVDSKRKTCDMLDFCRKHSYFPWQYFRLKNCTSHRPPIGVVPVPPITKKCESPQQTHLSPPNFCHYLCGILRNHFGRNSHVKCRKMRLWINKTTWLREMASILNEAISEAASIMFSQ